MKNIKIAFIRQKYNPFGGAERFVERALKSLSQYQVDMSVLSRKWDSRNSDYQFISCNPFYLGRLWRDWSFCRSVCRQLKGMSVDIIQSHERIACIDVYRAGDGVHKVWLSQKARSGRRWASIFSQLTPYHRYILSAEKKMFESPSLKAVICNSVMVRNEIIENFSIAADKCHVIYSGVDTDHFNPRLRDEYREVKRREYGIGQDDNVLLFVGSGFFRKGLASVIDAISKQQNPPYLMVVGNDRHINKYKKQADNYGLKNRVIFTGPQQDVRPYYGMADVFVLPSLYDPFPNAVLEAMACALPVIVSTKTGAAEFIRNDDQGYVVDTFDGQSLSQAIEKLMDPEHAQQAGQRARKKVKAYSLGAMADKLVAFYAQIIKR